MSLFCNWSLQINITKINSISLVNAFGFSMFTPSNSYYYVSDWGLNQIFILNESLSYVSNKDFYYPAYLTTIGSSLYATGQTNIWKLDLNLNILIQYNATVTYPNPRNRGIYFNSSNNFIYVAVSFYNEIHVFDLNLSLNHNISTSTFQPWSIAEYNNQLYVGTTNGTILVIVNEVILHTFNGCNGNSAVLSSVLFDQCGYMATSCNNPTNQLFLYHPNGTYFSKNYQTPANPRYIGYDSKGHFVQISAFQINIYN
jgi:hypothetical protein